MEAWCASREGREPLPIQNEYAGRGLTKDQLSWWTVTRVRIAYAEVLRLRAQAQAEQGIDPCQKQIIHRGPITDESVLPDTGGVQPF